MVKPDAALHPLQLHVYTIARWHANDAADIESVELFFLLCHRLAAWKSVRL